MLCSHLFDILSSHRLLISSSASSPSSKSLLFEKHFHFLCTPRAVWEWIFPRKQNTSIISYIQWIDKANKVKMVSRAAKCKMTNILFFDVIWSVVSEISWNLCWINNNLRNTLHCLGWSSLKNLGLALNVWIWVFNVQNLVFVYRYNKKTQTYCCML